MQEENVLNITFSLRLNSAISNKSLMQKDLSLATGIAHSAISKYLSGKALPRSPELVKLSRVLGVTTDYLLGLTDNTPTQTDIERYIVKLETKLALATASLQGTLKELKKP